MASREQRHGDQIRAAIEAKIAAWQAVLEKYKAAAALDGPIGDVALTDNPPRHPAERTADLPMGVFRDKGIKEGIPILLAAGRRKQTNKEIAQGLQKGGIASIAQNLESAVATALSRLKDEGVVLRFHDGWDLAESYPESLRNRLAKTSKRTASKQPAQSAGKPDADDKTVAILKLIGLSSGLGIQEIKAALAKQGIETSLDYVRVVTKRLRKRGLIEQRDGRFHSTMAAM